MTKIIDLGTNPVLGRLNAINRKHRLRSQHYSDIEDWPDTASIDVLDADAMGSADHYPCLDEIFVVSKKLRDVLESVDSDVEFFEATAGKDIVYVVAPITDDDVMYESEGYPPYSKSGYTILSATDLYVDEEPDEMFVPVRNSRFLALTDELVDAAQAAGVVWNVVDKVPEFVASKPHPYQILRGGYAAASADVINITSAWPKIAEKPHPLGENARDENFKKDPDEAWNALLQKETKDTLFARYVSGSDLPSVTAELDDDCAKSRQKKRWKEAKAAQFMSLRGVPVIATDTKELFESAGVEATYVQTSLHDPLLNETRDDLWILHPTHVVDWIDWSKSDVGLRFNGIYDEYLGFHPTEESYDSTIPVVRVAGSNIVLVHESLAAELSDDKGFYMTPLHHCLTSRNLDDGFNATR